ncbi:T9SS sorting signal type C domain-containing protein [Corallibacter sp.]|uniref:T9SS sorting signal type C domain-containing protein n=1 Tax=Corallibacter sp. TaxID=2038084 RepID=UPI003AB610F5
MMKKLLFSGCIFLSFFYGFSQSDDCGNIASAELIVNTTCNTQNWNNTSNTDNSWNYNGASCGENPRDDAWGWFDAISTSTTITYNPTQNGNVILTLFEGACNTNMSPVSCANDNGAPDAGNEETITYNTTVGQRYRVRIQRAGGNGSMNGTICVFDSSVASLPNDNPCNATNLNVNTGCIYTSFTNAGATNSSGIPAPGCANYSGGDIWFSVTVPTSGAIIIDSNSGSLTDSGMAVYSGGTCSSLTLIECDDDDSDNGLMSSINLTGRTPGETLYIRFWEYGNDDQGTFSICVSEPPAPPINDDCSGAIPLSSNSICNYSFYTNEAATASTGAPAPGCASYSGGDVWFSVVIGSTGEVTIDTQSAAVIDSGIAVYSGTCGALSLIECDDDDSDNGLMSSITLTGRTPGETIFIRFWEYGNYNQGTFGICATSPTPPDVYGVYLPCPGEPSQPLTSTIGCQGSLSIGNTINGNLNAATDNVALQPIIFISSSDPCQFDTTDTANYTSVNFTVDTSGVYTFAAETPTPYFDAMGYIYETASGFTPGTCSAGYIAGDDDDGPNLDPLITANLTTGVTYTLVTTIFDFSSTTHTGPFTWNVSGPPRDIDWYTTATGGSPIGSGSSFDPVGVTGSPLSNTNTPGIYSFWGACPDSPGTRFQADYIIGKVWNGSVDTNWYNDNNWMPTGIPTASDCVIIPDVATSNNRSPIADYAIFTPPTPPLPALGRNLTILANGFLEIENNSVIEITDWVNVDNDGFFLLRDSASLIQDPTETTNNNIGEISAQRSVNNLDDPYDYIYWSSPVESFDVENISPNTNPNLIWKWLPTQATGGGIGNHGDWRHPTPNELMSLGTGYIVRNLTGTTPYPDTPAVPNTTAEFTGRPNNGNVSVNITRGTHTTGNYQGDNGVANGTTPQDDNWNLIGNPYPSGISYTDFISANPYIDGTIYLWTHENTPAAIASPFYEDFVYNYSDDYIDNNYTGSNPPGFNGSIASGQAFFVLMLDNASTSEQVVFNNSMRNATIPNNQFYRSTISESRNTIERHRLWLDLVTPSNTAASILVGYIDGATNDTDRLYDGFEFEGNPTSFYSLIGENKMSIQGRTLPFTDTDLVPLGFKTPESGTHSIGLNTLDGLFLSTNQNIYLEDTHLNIIHDLRVSPYTFNIENGTHNNRFILRYTNNSLSTHEFDSNTGFTISAPNSKYIKVKSATSNINSVIVYDLLGRTLINKSEINSLETTIENLPYSDGAYIVQATLKNGLQKTQKVVLRQ